MLNVKNIEESLTKLDVRTTALWDQILTANKRFKLSSEQRLLNTQRIQNIEDNNMIHGISVDSELKHHSEYMKLLWGHIKIINETLTHDRAEPAWSAQNSKRIAAIDRRLITIEHRTENMEQIVNRINSHAMALLSLQEQIEKIDAKISDISDDIICYH